jgi:hypothetical protein
VTPTATTEPATATPDAVCAAAVELARAAAVEMAGADQVGEHLGCVAEGERLATHRFACLSPAYVGWHWAVTVARASRARAATVDEVCLLPGDGALLAPPWLPWSERLRPGDLGPGDLLPTSADDPRLAPGYTDADAAGTDDDPADASARREVGWELARDLRLDRPRVLSVDGLLDAADRWAHGEGGASTPIAQAAPAQCETCGFLVRLPGLLGQAFGLCANEWSARDGAVVALAHGCGAHSEVAHAPLHEAPSAHVVDSLGYDELGHS